MGRKPCEFCGGEASTYGKYVSCFTCRDKALGLLKRRKSWINRARRRNRRFRFYYQNRSN